MYRKFVNLTILMYTIALCISISAFQGKKPSNSGKNPRSCRFQILNLKRFNP
eukprot:c33511_g1_i1 orf=201-356(+)